MARKGFAWLHAENRRSKTKDHIQQPSHPVEYADGNLIDKGEAGWEALRNMHSSGRGEGRSGGLFRRTEHPRTCLLRFGRGTRALASQSGPHPCRVLLPRNHRTVASSPARARSRSTSDLFGCAGVYNARGSLPRAHATGATDAINDTCKSKPALHMAHLLLFRLAERSPGVALDP
ncbi:hypothetical protein HPB50_010697 [Hyalomma asiaticum]|uniref:Uncharacterized protein n=1 Tax=Hyalomma asiaticum TaxID=266040 RepID=A0ACB7SG56_HYAAI|nr:hypothetical protein HPB50_010697 [Hyalomma asiaticum]